MEKENSTTEKSENFSPEKIREIESKAHKKNHDWYTTIGLAATGDKTKAGELDSDGLTYSGRNARDGTPLVEHFVQRPKDGDQGVWYFFFGATTI